MKFKSIDLNSCYTTTLSLITKGKNNTNRDVKKGRTDLIPCFIEFELDYKEELMTITFIMDHRPAHCLSVSTRSRVRVPATHGCFFGTDILIFRNTFLFVLLHTHRRTRYAHNRIHNHSNPIRLFQGTGPIQTGSEWGETS